MSYLSCSVKSSKELDRRHNSGINAACITDEPLERETNRHTFLIKHLIFIYLFVTVNIYAVEMETGQGFASVAPVETMWQTFYLVLKLYIRWEGITPCTPAVQMHSSLCISI